MSGTLIFSFSMGVVGPPETLSSEESDKFRV